MRVATPLIATPDKVEIKPLEFIEPTDPTHKILLRIALILNRDQVGSDFAISNYAVHEILVVHEDDAHAIAAFAALIVSFDNMDTVLLRSASMLKIARDPLYIQDVIAKWPESIY